MYISDEVAIDKFDEKCRVDWHGIPPYMRGGLARYVMWGIKPGDFLTSVLTNDFKGAVTRADVTNKQCLVDYAYFVFQVPGNCQGSREKFDHWVAQGGLMGRCEKCGGCWLCRNLL